MRKERVIGWLVAAVIIVVYGLNWFVFPVYEIKDGPPGDERVVLSYRVNKITGRVMLCYGHSLEHICAKIKQMKNPSLNEVLDRYF